MQGNQHQLTYSFMQRVFGFKKDGLYDPPSTFRLNEFWTFLIDLPTKYHPKKAKLYILKI